ncbi:MAG TPA: sigma-70 family RNA polymerase sigma factor [Verrucomicrobiota bacterium]|nr:RNA polymerase subunit sigma-24 [Verrucomicrobiales bacterium]HRI12543.1 sigma-70 family RNA polymerase sigma factor [Verrucomicrobiota bacterium]
MPPAVPNITPEPERSGHFATTHWSVVLAAGDLEAPAASQALEKLCQTYWYPLYAFVRRRGYGVEEAQDLTQEFFFRLFDKGWLVQANRDKGRFRTFLLASLNHLLANEWDKANRLKRGGGQEHLSLDLAPGEDRFQLEPADSVNPERAFDQNWAQATLDAVVDSLEQECVAGGHRERFTVLREFLLGDSEGLSYADAATRLGMGVNGVTSAIYRLRIRFRELFRITIAHTVATPEAVDEEIRYLATVLEG